MNLDAHGNSLLCIAGVTIGFNPVDYSVNEPDGQVTLSFEVLMGTLEREVTVRFMTQPDSATEAGE